MLLVLMTGTCAHQYTHCCLGEVWKEALAHSIIVLSVESLGRRPSQTHLVHRVKLQTDSILERSINKWCLLLEAGLTQDLMMIRCRQQKLITYCINLIKGLFYIDGS